MTDRHRQIVVQLDHTYRDDDAEQIMQAIRMVKGVVDVRLGPVDDIAMDMQRADVKRTVWEKIRKFLVDDFDELNKYGGG